MADNGNTLFSLQYSDDDEVNLLNFSKMSSVVGGDGGGQGVAAKKRFVCVQSVFSTAYASNLGAHVKIGAPEGQDHKCPLCKYTANRQLALARCQGPPRPVKDLFCPHCPMSFSFSGDLPKHVKAVHDGEKKEFGCPHCSFLP